MWDAAFIFIDESLARFVARTRVGELVRERRKAKGERRKAKGERRELGPKPEVVRAYQIIIGSVLLQVTRRLCLRRFQSKQGKANTICSAGGVMQQAINQSAERLAEN